MAQHSPSHLARPALRGRFRLLAFIVACSLGALVAGAGSAGTAAAQPLTSSGWTTNGAVNRASSVPGQTVTVTVTVKSATARSALIDLELYSPTSIVRQTYVDQQAFTAGQTRTYSINYVVPADARTGTYTARVGVFGNAWNGLQHWNDSAATFAVTSSTTTTVPTTTTTTVPPTTTTTPTTQAPVGTKFVTLPPGSALPTEAQCAGRVRKASEIRPKNATANSTKGSAPHATIARVTGNFTGTTDEILQWTACKWGIDEDIVRAQIAKESWWKQSAAGDLTTDQSACHPSLRTAAGTQCPESYGLGQVRYLYHSPAMTDSIRSSAYNVDYTYAMWRSCYEGNETWLNQFERGKDYAAGDVWGCVGLWFSGRWHTQPAKDYIAAVQSYLNQRIWTAATFVKDQG